MPDRSARGADLIGMITGQHRSLTKTIAAAGPIRERRGPESTMGGSMAATGGPLKKGVKMKAGGARQCCSAAQHGAAATDSCTLPLLALVQCVPIARTATQLSG